MASTDPWAFPISRAPIACRSPMCRAAWNSACPTMRDFNSGQQEGAGLYQTTTQNGRRCSAAVGYLKPALNAAQPHAPHRCPRQPHHRRERPRHGRRDRRRQPVERIDAASEVIVTAGAIGSPKLLMLSGIGPAGHLKEVGVPVVHDLRGVGQNFHDHFSTDVTWVLNGPHSYDKYKKKHWQALGRPAIRSVPHPARSPPTSSRPAPSGGATAARKTPDLQFHFLAGAGVEEGVGTVPGGNGATCNSYHVRPRSRGHVTAALGQSRRCAASSIPIPSPSPMISTATSTASRSPRKWAAPRAMRKFVVRRAFPRPRREDASGLRGLCALQCPLLLSSRRHLQDGER